MTPTVKQMHRGGNHRPVSLTSVVLRNFVGVLSVMVVNHLKANQQIMVEEHRFSQIPFRVTNLIRILDKLTDRIGKGERVGVSNLDLQKVLDSVNYRIIDEKVEAFRVDAGVNNWFAQNRKIF